MPALLVCSPHSGSASPPEVIVAALVAAGLPVVRWVAVADLPAEPQGEAWIAEGIDTVVAAGGDGTLGSVATHIGDSALRMGILPLGTANDTARSLDLPLDLEAAVAVVAGGRTVAIDVGEVIADDGRRARFLHAATIGLNVEFARLATDTERRQRLGPFNFPAAAFQALVNTRWRKILLRLHDGTVVEGSAVQVGALNLPHVLGGTLGMDVPDVDARDGLLTFLIVRDLLTIERVQTKAARVETDTPDEVTLDGELMFETPVTMRIAERRIRVIVP